MFVLSSKIKWNKSKGVVIVWLGYGSEIGTDSFMSYYLMIFCALKKHMHGGAMSEELFSI